MTGSTGQARRELEAELPPVTLLLGQPAGELRSLAAHLARFHGVHVSDCVTVRVLTADAARMLVGFAGTAPFGPFKLAVVELDGASEQAQAVLLKVLEEPPPPVRFLLTASRPPLGTVMSRARVCRLGTAPPPGSPEEQDAERDEARARAAAAVRAAMSGDLALFSEELRRGWDEQCPCARVPGRHPRGEHYLDALRSWAVSQGCRHRPGLFPGGPLEPEVPARLARRVLRLLAGYPKARPANAAFCALHDTFLEDGP